MKFSLKVLVVAVGLSLFSGMGMGYFFRRAVEHEVQGMMEENLKLIAKVGSGIEVGNQLGALAGMRAMEQVELSRPADAIDTMSLLVANYYNMHGPARKPRDYVGKDGREILIKIEEFAKIRPGLKEHLKE